MKFGFVGLTEQYFAVQGIAKCSRRYGPLA